MLEKDPELSFSLLVSPFAYKIEHVVCETDHRCSESKRLNKMQGGRHVFSSVF